MKKKTYVAPQAQIVELASEALMLSGGSQHNPEISSDANEFYMFEDAPSPSRKFGYDDDWHCFIVESN